MPALHILKPGESGVVIALTAEGAVRRRLLDMGITRGVRVTMVRVAPFGDPLAVRLRGYCLSLRRAEAERILLGGIEGSNHENKDVCHDWQSK